jgi:hypothetical protein
MRCAATMKSWQGMLIAGVMAGVAYVALTIPRLVTLEVVEGLCPPPGQRSMITVMRIIAVVDVAIKAVRAVEPGPSSKKDPAHKPIWAVVAVGRTVIWSVVEVPVGAHRRHSNVDGNLRRRQACAA